MVDRDAAKEVLKDTSWLKDGNLDTNQDYVARKAVWDGEGSYKIFVLRWRDMMNGTQAKSIDSFSELARRLGVKLDTDKIKPAHDLTSMRSAVEGRYELLDCLRTSSWDWDWTKGFGDKIVNYINVIDVCNTTK